MGGSNSCEKCEKKAEIISRLSQTTSDLSERLARSVDRADGLAIRVTSLNAQINDWKGGPWLWLERLGASGSILELARAGTALARSVALYRPLLFAGAVLTCAVQFLSCLGPCTYGAGLPSGMCTLYYPTGFVTDLSIRRSRWRR